MATRAGVGMSFNHSPNVAGREAAEKALKKAGVNEPDFVFMFASAGSWEVPYQDCEFWTIPKRRIFAVACALLACG